MQAPPAGRAITPAKVAADTAVDYTGTLVRWGGVLTGSRHERAQTVLEVLSYPLDDCGRPRTQLPPTGRFLIVHPGYLETADWENGRLVTASGRILGTKPGQVGEAPYGFPLLEGFKPTLWPAAEDSRTVSRPWVSIGIGGGHGGVGGGVGVLF